MPSRSLLICVRSSAGRNHALAAKEKSSPVARYAYMARLPIRALSARRLVEIALIAFIVATSAYMYIAIRANLRLQARERHAYAVCRACGLSEDGVTTLILTMHKPGETRDGLSAFFDAALNGNPEQRTACEPCIDAIMPAASP